MDLNRQADSPAEVGQRNVRTAMKLGAVVAGMIGLSFASVPLYDLFCRVTGFGGTTMVSEKAPEKALERVITVRFNGDVNSSINWDFRPDTTAVNVHVGEAMTMSYRAQNLENHAVVGTATYNVTPEKAGKYFNKIQCFCFTEQKLEPGQSIDMPVNFYVDPAIADDPGMADVKTITLSYTFFRADDQSAALSTPGKGAAVAPLDGAMGKDYQGLAPGLVSEPTAGAVPGNRS
ncbi:cytochrome c oxidase assembly protein [Niveispirillum lacus]|uniref:Cytochrome c oxidase assembly protein CtaG n=2 Tax=Niveispirillum lacus TaxID=1981099 RepID=A0A255YVW6_9PROT|nr:cytochrome c oxidase assembly protein [Niveispirillum lacus]